MKCRYGNGSVLLRWQSYVFGTSKIIGGCRATPAAPSKNRCGNTDGSARRGAALGVRGFAGFAALLGFVPAVFGALGNRLVLDRDGLRCGVGATIAFEELRSARPVTIRTSRLRGAYVEFETNLILERRAGPDFVCASFDFLDGDSRDRLLEAIRARFAR